MKKNSLLLAVLLTFALLSGCGAESAPTEPSVPETTAAPTAPTTAPTAPPDPVVIDFKLDVPEGFDLSVVEDTIQVYSSPKSPRDPSHVTIEILPRDESVLTMDAAQMTQRIIDLGRQEPVPSDASQPSSPEEPTEAQQRSDPFIQFLEDEKVDGWDAVFVDYVHSLMDYNSHIYRYEVVTTDANYVFSFCDSTDHNDWLEEFDKCAESIDLILDTEGMKPDYSHLTKYSLRSGLTIHAEADLKKRDAEDFTDALANRNVMILTMADDKVTNNLTQMTLKDYAELVANSNALEPFKEDMYDNLVTTFYSTDEAGLEYYNMICVKETAEKFWVVQMTCLANDQVNYAKEFVLWASSIS